MGKHRFVCAAAVLLLGAATAFAQPPVNDDFANRTVLSGSSVSFGGSLTNSTLEAGEPPLPGGSSPSNGSIWWAWDAPTSGPVVISVSRDYSTGSSLGAAFEVFSGADLTDLQGLDYASFEVPAGRYVKFAAVAGSTNHYQFRVSGRWPGAFSAQLTASSSPVIIQQPESCTISPYGSAVFYVIAAGLPAPAFQWMYNGAPLPGQTAPILTVHNILTNAAGSYSVTVSNSGGATQSAAAICSVTDTNPVPSLTAFPPANTSQVPFLLTGEPGRWYRFEVSGDLVYWFHDPPWSGYWYGQATNTLNSFSVPRLSNARQFIKASLNVPTDACVAQLKAMSAALDLHAIENKQPPMLSYTLTDLKPYIKLGPGNDLPYCPGSGTYVAGSTITNPTTCSLSSAAGHRLPP